MLLVGSEKCGIVIKTADIAGFSGFSPSLQKLSGLEQAFFCDIASNGASCFFLKGAHHMVGAHGNKRGQAIYFQLFLQMLIDIGDKS